MIALHVDTVMSMLQDMLLRIDKEWSHIIIIIENSIDWKVNEDTLTKASMNGHLRKR